MLHRVFWSVLLAWCGLSAACSDESPSNANNYNDPNCSIGAAGCACTAGGACDDGLYCNNARICQPDRGCGDGLVGPTEPCDGETFANGHCDACQIVCDDGYANCGGGTVDGCETLGSCAPTLLVADAGNWPRSLAVLGSKLFWVDWDPLSGSIRQVSVDGGTAYRIASAQNAPYALAVNATHVYWANAAEVNPDGDPLDGGIFRAPLGGGEPVLLEAESIPFDVAIDADYVFWVAGESGAFAYVGHDTLSGTFTTNGQIRLAPGQAKPRAVSTWAGDAYWINTGLGDTDGSVSRIPATGGVATVLVVSQPRPVDIAVSSAGVVWLNRGPRDANFAFLDGAVMRVDHDGANPTTLADGQNDPDALAVDELFAYWVTGDGKVMRVAHGGGTATPLATEQSLPCGLAVADTHVYWSTCGDGAIWSVAK